MKNKFLLLGLLSALISLTRCKEFIESSLKDKKVVLLAPADQHQTNRYTVNFWWDEVDDALGYRLQIVSPRFDSISFLAMDTLVKTNKFTTVLDPGRYEWRVRAENGSSQSLYATGSFIVLASDMKDQQVQLKSPANNLHTNIKDVTYKWEALYGASTYRLQIDTSNFADDSILVFNGTTPGTEFLVPFGRERAYQWRVRAESDTAISRWSSIQMITYDATPPAKVSLSSPASNASVSKPVTMQWNSIPGGAKYQLLVLKSDSTTVYNSTFPVTTTGTSHTFNSGTQNERIYWKVRAVDAAGNPGQYSDLRNFTIQ